MSDVIDLLDTGAQSNIVREINENCNIRRGKTGKSDYIFYKTTKMKKPEFINLKKFEHDYKNCDLSLIIDFVESNKKYK